MSIGAAALLPLPRPGVVRMSNLLESITRELDPMKNPFLNRARAERLGAELAPLRAVPPSGDTITRRFQLQLRHATELLNSGQPARAIEVLQELESILKSGNAYEAKPRAAVRALLAVCFLRMGEQENCLKHHTSDSCLLPIRGAGVHTEQRGSRGAVEVLLGMLGEAPRDLRARWLLNVAAMTLGEHPAKVPPQFLIPTSAFDSEVAFPRFPEVAPAVGLDVDALAGGVVMDDFDGDGNLDLIVSSMGVRDQIRYFHNNGDGTFRDETAAAGLVGEVGGLNLLSADYDNDGRLDFLILRGGWMGAGGHYPSSLLHNNGDGTFEDVTEAVGLLSPHPTQTATWLDYNGDGWLDLFVAHESTAQDAPQPCQLFRANGDGTFADVTAECGLGLTGMFKAVVSGDFNNDGRPDLFLSWRGHDNVLFRNDGPKEATLGSRSPWRFTDVTAEAGVQQPLLSFPAWFFDYDNDNWPDLFVSGYGINNVGDIAADYLKLPTPAERVRLFHNNRDGTFTDVTRTANLYKVIHSMGSNFGDLDNDGWLDFYLGTGDPDLSTIVPNRMFRNAEGRVFQDVTTAGGFGHLQKGHGVAFGDLDNDGDQDVYSVIGGAFEGDNYRNALFENPGTTNHWVTLKLEGVRSNRSAIGARLVVTVATAAGDRVICRTVSTGGSFGCSPLRAEIGLGQALAIKSIAITWPIADAGGPALKRTPQVLAGLPMDAFYRIREGETQAVPWKLKAFRLPTAAGAGAGTGHEHRHGGN